MTRKLRESDIPELQRIHEKFYAQEFDFPNFLPRFIDPIVVTNREGKIITGGGILPIAETIILTDKDTQLGERMKGLKEMFDDNLYTAKRYGFSRLHAFVHEYNWLKYLEKAGFEPCKGKILSIGV
jgi:hypothetical protein